MPSTKRAWSLLAMLPLLGCGGAGGGAGPAPDHDHHHHREPVVAAEGASDLLELPTPDAEGEPREVRVLVDRPSLKLALITLRDGTELPTHSAPVPVTIHVLEGTGTASSGEERLRYEPGAIWLLEAGQPHAITPDPGVTMVLLVHYLRGATGEGR